MHPKKIVFSGVGKDYDELNLAIKKKILLINVESESEIKQIEKIANKRKIKVNIGIRLNPDIDPLTINFVKLRELVMALEDFNEGNTTCGEKVLEAIQMCWIDEK